MHPGVWVKFCFVQHRNNNLEPLEQSRCLRSDGGERSSSGGGASEVGVIGGTDEELYKPQRLAHSLTGRDRASAAFVKLFTGSGIHINQPKSRLRGNKL